MDTPRIQFGSSEKTRVIDDKTKLTTATNYHGGRGITTNKITIREKIPTSRPTITELERIMHEHLLNPDRINPQIGFESHTNDNGTAHYMILSYTVLEVD